MLKYHKYKVMRCSTSGNMSATPIADLDSNCQLVKVVNASSFDEAIALALGSEAKTLKKDHNGHLVDVNGKHIVVRRQIARLL